MIPPEILVIEWENSRLFRSNVNLLVGGSDNNSLFIVSYRQFCEYLYICFF
jgi:hypothetical protein